MARDIRDFLANAKGSAAGGQLVTLDQLAPVAARNPWSLDEMRGRLVELSAQHAPATLTVAFDLVLEAQLAAEPVAWVTLANATFFPPDVAEIGVDLAALVVVRARDATSVARAAENLLRSSAFGLVVMDFGGAGDVELRLGDLGRLVKLAQRHDAAVVCITKKSDQSPSLGSVVSLRAEALRLQGDADHYPTTLRVVKDKRRGPGWTSSTRRRGPAGF